MKISQVVSNIIAKVNLATTHIANSSNPHSVTKTQIGLGNVINVAQLANSQTLSITGDITATSTALNTGTIATTLSNSGVAAATYGSSTNIPQIVVDAKGRITSASNVAVSIPSGSISVTGGDFTLSGNTGTAITNATLANSGVAAGTYKSVTVDTKGRVTNGTNPTTLAGYGITDAQAKDNDLTAIAALAGTTGLLKKTAADTWTLDTNAYVTSSGVTSVTGTAPIVSSGGVTPAISIAAATASVNGYMTSAYASKLDGIAVSANNYVHPTTDGNLHVPATGTTNNGKVLTAGATAGSLSWTVPTVGTVTSVTAGNGMTQSGTGTVNPTLNIVSHAGTAGSIGTINVSADAIGVNLGTTSTTAARGDHTHNYAGSSSAGGAATTALVCTGNAATATTATSANALNSVSYKTLDAVAKAECVITGGGTITVSSTWYVLWSQRFILTNNGNGAHLSTSGYFNITCPVSGTITGVGGAANKTATAAGIPLASWESLYYILPIGSTYGTVAANFRVVGYTSALEIPATWIKICSFNGDANYIEFANGVSLKNNQSLNTTLYDSYEVYSAERLRTARTINGVSFNGSANITVEPYIEHDTSSPYLRYLTFVDSGVAGYQRLNIKPYNLAFLPSEDILMTRRIASVSTSCALTPATRLLRDGNTIGDTYSRSWLSKLSDTGSGHNSMCVIVGGQIYTGHANTSIYANYTNSRSASGTDPFMGISHNFRQVPKDTNIWPESGYKSVQLVGHNMIATDDLPNSNSAGRIFGCGYNNTGELGLGNTIASPYFKYLGISYCVPKYYHAQEYNPGAGVGIVGWTNSGSASYIYHTGYNAYGIASDGTTTNHTTLTGTIFHGSETIVKMFIIGSNVQMGYALSSAGRIYAWGYNGHGALGNGNTTNQTTRVDVTLAWAGVSSGVQDIDVVGCVYYNNAAAQTTMMAIKVSGNWKIRTCGYNGHGQLGDSTTVSKSTPVTPNVINGSYTIQPDIDICGTPGTMRCVINNAGNTTYVWGHNPYGQCGNNTTSSVLVPTVPIGMISGYSKLIGKDFSSYGNGYTHVSFLNVDGRVGAAGHNVYGECGVGDTTNKLVYTEVMAFKHGTSIKGIVTMQSSANGSTYLALTEKGELFTWGYNGQNNITEYQTLDVRVPTKINIAAEENPSWLTY